MRVQKGNPQKSGFYSREAHVERLNELFEWAKTNEQILKCLKRDTRKKANRLLKEESMGRFGIGSRLANEYAKVTFVRLKTGRSVYTRWGLLQ